MLTANRYHRQVIEWIAAIGLEYVEEFSVGPYSLDIYLPEMKLAVELDGPQHNRRKDAIRDHIVLTDFGIRTVRFKVGARKRDVMKGILP